MAKKKMDWCNANARFPTFAVIVLILGMLWLFSEVGVIAIKIPWWPVLVVLIAIGWIIDFYLKKTNE